jgi:Pyridoxamine 5'-phosphate oxidase
LKAGRTKDHGTPKPAGPLPYPPRIARWTEIEAEAPELTALARRIFDSHVHKTIATLRRDGSPRISGTEVQFDDGDLLIGSMWRAMKALDLLRDPRFALHSRSGDLPPPPDDPAAQPGDAKIAGRMEEVTDSERTGRSHRFRADIDELVVITIGGDPPDHMVIEAWHEGRGVSRRQR